MKYSNWDWIAQKVSIWLKTILKQIICSEDLRLWKNKICNQHNFQFNKTNTLIHTDYVCILEIYQHYFSIYRVNMRVVSTLKFWVISCRTIANRFQFNLLNWNYSWLITNGYDWTCLWAIYLKNGLIQYLKIQLCQVKVALHYRILAYSPYLKLYSKTLFSDQDHHCAFSLMHNQVRILQQLLKIKSYFPSLLAVDGPIMLEPE